MSVREKDDPSLFYKIQEQNLLRQYDLLSNSIEIGLKKDIEPFDKYPLWALNYAAVSNICQLGGRYREGPIRVGNHVPPHFNRVPALMDAFFSVIHENWTIVDHPTALAAFALRNLNHIHPFIEGNGRTARAACYYLICMKQGKILGGRKTVPERIRENRKPYIDCFFQAEGGIENGQYDVTELTKYLGALLKGQLSEP